jgi:hypothetical protein
MKEVYRIKKGNIICQNLEIPFYFGLIFEDDGLFLVDLYISESYDLESLILNKENDLYSYYSTLSAQTEENNLIEVTTLTARSVSPHESKIQMKSYGFLKHTKIQYKPNGEQDDLKGEEDFLFYLEIEGLKMEFSDLTQTIKARGGVEIKDFDNYKRDHTDALLLYQNYNGPGSQFLFTFFKNEENENIIISVSDDIKGYSILTYDKFMEFKTEFVYLLSFLNGAEIAIKKECIGRFYSINKINSEKVIIYSFNTIKNNRHNDYIPLNNPFHRSDNILNCVFIKCFNKYIEENKKLDLNSIIFYLNGAEQTRSLEEAFFIQIIAFERLAKKYIDTLNEENYSFLTEEEFAPIKTELIAIFKNYIPLYGDKLNRLRSRIGELNLIKNTSTEYKFLKLLEYANIPINPNIQNIINVVRHESIHQGEIGVGENAYKNKMVLDQLIRDIILNIIGYERKRISRIE